MATCPHILLAILWLLGTLTVCRGGIWAYVKWDAGGPQVGLADIEEEIPDEAVASGYYSNEINSTGWAYLEVKTSASAPDERQAYSAGVVEGYLTRDLIWYHWMNLLQDYCINKSSVCDMVEKFIDDNEDFVGRNLERNPEDPYWYQVKLFYIQLEGLAYGYNGATKNPDEKLSLRDVLYAPLWLNLLGDLDELAYALVVRHNGSAPAPDADERCTGLVKLLPDHSDLYVAHVTWNSYQSMLRVQKMYDLQYGATPSCREKLPGRRMTMSSYPGFVQSSDDFYVVSSGLVVAETTIGNTNASLFLEVQPEDSLFEFVRAMVASRLATSGEQWAWFFKRYNSGTYNNQWYIVDYTRFSPAAGRAPARLRRGLLWLLEQAPGYTASADITEQLTKESYFGSYNIPYFKKMFDLTGGTERVRSFGAWFGYDTNPRALIIREQQSTISSLRDMYRVARYNDYKHDALSRCPECRPPYSACNAIAARNDLNPADGWYPFRALGHRSHGATDAKITSYKLHKQLKFIAVSSPPHNTSRGLPPFRWSKFDLKVPHMGHPDLWTFPPVVHSWNHGGDGTTNDDD